MLVCCCSLAGTPACFNCSRFNNLPMPQVPQEWDELAKELERLNKPKESQEDMIRRIIREELKDK